MTDNFISQDMTLEEAQTVHQQLKSLETQMRKMLLEMRDRKGWRVLGYESWEQYGAKEWGYSRQHLNRLATAAYLQNVVEPKGSTEIAETHLRPLTALPDDEIRKQVWEEVKNKNEKVTAKAVQEAVSEWKAENAVSPDEVPCYETLAGCVVESKITGLLAQDWGANILDSSPIIVAEQKKTAAAQRQIKKLMAEQDNLVQKGVETILTNVMMQMMLVNSYVASIENYNGG